MPQVVVTEGAARGIARCLRFLSRQDKDAANRAAQAIDGRFAALRSYPEIGRPARRRSGRRELVIPFGNTGYLALYRYDVAEDRVYVLAFRHQREAGYRRS